MLNPNSGPMSFSSISFACAAETNDTPSSAIAVVFPEDLTKFVLRVSTRGPATREQAPGREWAGLARFER